MVAKNAKETAPVDQAELENEDTRRTRHSLVVRGKDICKPDAFGGLSV